MSHGTDSNDWGWLGNQVLTSLAQDEWQLPPRPLASCSLCTSYKKERRGRSGETSNTFFNCCITCLSCKTGWWDHLLYRTRKGGIRQAGTLEPCKHVAMNTFWISTNLYFPPGCDWVTLIWGEIEFSAISGSRRAPGSWAATLEKREMYISAHTSCYYEM